MWGCNKSLWLFCDIFKESEKLKFLVGNLKFLCCKRKFLHSFSCILKVNLCDEFILTWFTYNSNMGEPD